MVHVPESESLEHKILAFCKFCLKFYLPRGELINFNETINCISERNDTGKFSK